MARRRIYDYNDSEIDTFKDKSPVIEETKEPVTRIGVVCNASHVRVRKEPAALSDVVTVLDKDTIVTILGKSIGMFYKIRIDLGDGKHITGYISRNYCEEVLM